MLCSSLVALLALLIDQLLGEPRRFHPLVGFGGMANGIEQLFNKAEKKQSSKLRLHGAIAVSLLVLTPALLTQVIYASLPGYAQIVFAVLVLYFCIARRSLFEHATAVASATGSGLAKQQLAKIVSRDTADMNDADIHRAVIESTLENGSDSIIAPLFWFVLAGPAAAVCYRCANTLDAMWGYRNGRYEYFGWAAAKLDDGLNYIPARLTALGYSLMQAWPRGWRCWQQQAKQCASPNGGPVMCAGAGALGIRLGGAAHYHGQLQQRPEMGVGDAPKLADIARSVTLVDRCLGLWLVILVVGGLLCYSV